MRSILEGGPAIMTAAAVVLLAAACSADGAPPAVVVRDSAGVRITEIAVSLGEARSRWSISSEPILDIGVEHGDAAYEFDGIASAGRLTDGTIAIANSGSGQIRVFDAEGRYLRSMGGLGQGPGEFNRIAWMQIGSSDTVLVIDPELRRVTAFGSGGELAWIARIDGTGYAWPGDFRMPDGSFVIVSETGDVWDRIRSGSVRPGSTDRNTAILLRYTAEGALLDTLGRFPGYEEAVIETNGRPGSTYPPWGRLIRHAVADHLIYVGTQEDGVVTAFRPDGSAAEIIRWPAGDLTLTDADIDRFIEAHLERVPDDSANRAAVVERTRTVPLPPTRPAFGRLLVDRTGLLWISEAHLVIEPPTRWTAVEPGRGIVGQIELPPQFDVYEIGPDYLLGRWTDGLGVEHVRMYRIDASERLAGQAVSAGQ